MRYGLSLGLLFIASIASAHMPRNSYLAYCAHSTSELVHEVKTNPVVVARYERHFQMTPTQVVQYFSTLHVETLEETKVYTMYSVPKGGWIKSHLQTLHAGQKVWADQSGSPVLFYACGNPISTSGFNRPAPTQGMVASTTPTPQGHATSPNEIVSPSNEIALLPSTPSTPLPPTINTPVTPVVPIYVKSSSNNLLPFALLAGAGIIAASNHHSTTIITTCCNCKVPPQPVPAPSSALALGIPLSGLFFLKRRKN